MPNPDVLQLEQLYRQIGPDLLCFFRGRIPPGVAAEDLVHDTFVRAIEGIHRLRNSVTPRAYLFGIARHMAADAHRRKRPHEALLDEPAAPHDAEDARLEPMRLAIGELPQTLRETLRLKLEHDLSYDELAEILEVPVGTIRSRLHHAVCKLREAMSDHPEGLPTRRKS